jgi:DNA-binding NarL/FixJ family response regulator
LRLSLTDTLIIRLCAVDKQPMGHKQNLPVMRTVDPDRAAPPGIIVPQHPLRLILVDDHAILRAGLRALLAAARDVELIAEASNVADGIALVKRLRPDVVIIDVSFPVGSGLEAIGALRRAYEGARIIVLTVHNTVECLRAAMRAGADEFVAKQAPFEILLKAICAETSRTGRAAHSLPSTEMRGSLEVREHPVPIRKLTPREYEVLLGVAQGYTSKQIAAKLERSVKTIVKHRSNMMRKLSLHDASSVTRFAIANKLLSP